MLGDAVAASFRTNGVDADVAGRHFIGSLDRVEPPGPCGGRQGHEMRLARRRVGEAAGDRLERRLLAGGGERESEDEQAQRKLSA
jgi:hypothetical protein